MRTHGGRIYGLGLRLCGDPAQAEDLVQETFLAAYRGWEGFEGRSEPSTWLYTIARRLCQRLHRRQSGEPRTLETLDELLPGNDATVADPARFDPHDERLRHEVSETVDRALAELPLDFRLALVLVDIAELSLAEAAAVLAVPINTVKTRVHRARLRLRRAIDAGLPQRSIERTQPAQVCYAMLQAKQLALDHEAPFPYPESALCERCKGVFAALDLGKDACVAIGRGELPPDVAAAVERALSAARSSRDVPPH